MQLEQPLLSAAGFHEVDHCCSAAGVEGSGCCGRREAPFLVFLVAAAVTLLYLVPFSLCSPHPCSSLAQHVVQQLGATLREESSVLPGTMQQAQFLLLHLLFTLYFMLYLGRCWNAICCGFLTNFHNQQMYFVFHSFFKRICTVWMCLQRGHLLTRV